jgi:hypothetical protein
MKTSNEHKENQHRADLHKEKLGMEIPEGYFSRSKKDILATLPKNKQPRRLIFGLKPVFAYPIAASLILMIGILFLTRFGDEAADLQLTEIETSAYNFPSEDLLISSLLVKDDQLNQFMDDYIMYEIIEEAERSEQELENVFLNSLFVEDSLIDTYVDKNLMDQLVL